MRILYDHQVFSLQNSGGISRYHFELASHLNRLADVDVDIYLGFNRTVYPFNSVKKPGARILNWATNICPGLPRYALNELVTGAYAFASGRWDIYHPTLYRSMPSVRSRYTVVTHHDCVHEHFPELFKDFRRVTNAKKRLYATADFVICVSESSRDDLLTFYTVDRGKTHVVHHGVSRLERNPEQAGEFIARVRKPYLLYVGARYSYKNFGTFLATYGSGGFTRDFDLVVVGGGDFTESERRDIRRLGIADSVMSYGSVTDAELAEAYSRAHLLVYPSLYEGFGFPPLEAMSLGCPVVAARTSSIPEVCGDAAYYFEPAKTDDLDTCLRAALDDPDRQTHIARGLKIAFRYDWWTCAAETLDVYARLQGNMIHSGITSAQRTS